MYIILLSKQFSWLCVACLLLVTFIYFYLLIFSSSDMISIKKVTSTTNKTFKFDLNLYVDQNLISVNLTSYCSIFKKISNYSISSLKIAGKQRQEHQKIKPMYAYDYVVSSWLISIFPISESKYF